MTFNLFKDKSAKTSSVLLIYLESNRMEEKNS